MSGRFAALIAPLLAAGLLQACASRSAVANLNGPSPADIARADSGRSPFTAADVHFVSGMIAHHAQAVLMASWAPSHGASPALRGLCERVVVGQGDEIIVMQDWLRFRHQPVPEPDPRGMRMAGMDHVMPMPGMLTPQQMAQLDAARGVEFDRLFLRFMIIHHQGALVMVDEVLGAIGSAQDVTVYKLASDIHADQTTEIEFMSNMLAALPSGGRQ